MIDAFVTYLEAEKRYSPLTVRNYRHDVGTFLAWLGVADADFHPALVSADDIRGWIVSLSETHRLSPASINSRVSSVRSLFRWLRATGIIEKNPFVKIRTLKTSRRLPVWIPEKKMSEVTASLFDKCTSGDPLERRNALILLLFYSCGIRLAELVKITADDISDDFRSLRVHGKGDKTRVVPLPSATAEILKRHRDEISASKIWKSDKKPLFLTEKGEAVSRGAVYDLVREELGSMGVQGKRSPHILRHTFATHLLDGGADMREIQELLGHTSLAATQVYTHNSIARLKKVYKSAHPREGAGTTEELGQNKDGKQINDGGRSPRGAHDNNLITKEEQR